ncbi:50S ribosomal protein L9 [Bacteroidia bacterium]|nr:50S ribosomal protein L9 [Bacteroidia bacterium]
MEVILLQDVAKLGYKNDIVKVKNGYANNYLLPQGLAVMATEALRKVNAENIKQQAKKTEKFKVDAETLANKLNAIELTFELKSSSNGKLFGTIKAINVSDALREKHEIELDSKKLTLPHIKEVGDYRAIAHLHKDINCEIAIKVVAVE